MITLRDFTFNLEESKVKNYARNSKITRVLNSFSLLLPVGERYFIESVRSYKDEVSENLKKDIELFIKQEGPHGLQHRNLNKMLGVDLSLTDSEALGILNKYGIDKEHKLLVTVTLERYTGLMGYTMPFVKKFLFPKQNEFAHLWIKHAKEEKEHIEVPEKLMKEVCNFSKVKQAKMFLIAGYELGRITVKNYKLLQTKSN